MYFPRFLWLARDFSLELEAGGERLTTNEYLERALAPIQVRGLGAGIGAALVSMDSSCQIPL